VAEAADFPRIGCRLGAAGPTGAPVTPHLMNRPLPSVVNRIVVQGVALAALLVAGCVPPPKKAVYNDPQPLSVQSFTRQWSVEVEPEVTKLFVRDKFVFAYSTTGLAYMLDRADGRIIAAHRIPHSELRLHGPVVLKDKVIYPTSTTLEIYDRSGEFIRSKNLHYSIRSEAVGSGNYLVFGADRSGGGRLVEVDVNDPVLDHRWELLFPNAAVSAAPVIVRDTVFAAAENGDAVAVSLDRREATWPTPDSMFHTSAAVKADLIADDTSLYIASMDQKLVCLTLNTAKVRWQYIGISELREPPTVTKDLVLQYVEGAGLVALSKESTEFNRTAKWTAPDARQFLAEDDKYIYARRQDNAIMAIDKSSGQVAFNSKRTDYVAFGPTLDNSGLIYAATTGGRIMAVKPVLTPGGVGEIVLVPTGAEAVAAAH
jgi:outer membrane protein assembly factor BamB